MSGSSSWMPYAPQGVKELNDDDDDDEAMQMNFIFFTICLLKSHTCNAPQNYNIM